MECLPDLTRLSLQPTSADLLFNDPRDEHEMPATGMHMPGDWKHGKSQADAKAEIVQPGVSPFGRLTDLERELLVVLAKRGFVAFRRDNDHVNGKPRMYLVEWVWRTRDFRLRIGDNDPVWDADWVKQHISQTARPTITIEKFKVHNLSVISEDGLRYALNITKHRLGARFNTATQLWEIRAFHYANGAMQHDLDLLVDRTTVFEKDVMNRLTQERQVQYQVRENARAARVLEEKKEEEERKKAVMALKKAEYEKRRQVEAEIEAERVATEAAKQRERERLRAAEAVEAARRRQEAERAWEELVQKIINGGELSDEDRLWFAASFDRRPQEADAALTQAVSEFYGRVYNARLGRDQVESNAVHVELSSFRLIQLESYLLGVANALTQDVVELFEAKNMHAHEDCDRMTGTAKRLVHLPAAQPQSDAAAAAGQPPRTIPVIVRATTHPSSIINNPSPPKSAEAAVVFTMRIASKCDGADALETSTPEERELYRQAVAYGMVEVGHYKRQFKAAAPDAYYTSSNISSPNTVRAMLEGLWRRYWLHTFGESGPDGPASAQTANQRLFERASALIGENPVNAQRGVAELNAVPPSSSAAGAAESGCEE